VTVPARRTCHLRVPAPQDPAPAPPGTGFATLVESDQPIIVQHTRLDSRQPANSIMTTIAHPL
ncbi:sensory rhodopsin transducer, partial [Stenotrophomonas maltophilia]|uniref:sensory rhodopsin transducer n=1 Tax=Stenotrophomonas maltophilia TaxID=40324 RepID=UPI0020A76196